MVGETYCSRSNAVTGRPAIREFQRVIVLNSLQIQEELAPAAGAEWFGQRCKAGKSLTSAHRATEP